MFQRFWPFLAITALVGLSAGSGLAQDWTASWSGTGRPGPESLPLTTGWPTDQAGLEQDDHANLVLPPGPHYAEQADVDVAGFLAIVNQLGSCVGIGPTWDPDPCGMRYKAGPNTYDYPELLHAQPGLSSGPEGLTFEISFYIPNEAALAGNWNEILYVNCHPWSGPMNGASTSQRFWVTARHFFNPSDPNEWHLVLVGADEYDIGLLSNLYGQWTTVRVALGDFSERPVHLWVNGAYRGHTTSASGGPGGVGNGAWAHFGSEVAGNDIRIGTMAYTNEGIFSPNPMGECVTRADVTKFLPYLPTVDKTRTTPEICDNSSDDDGDGLADCGDPDCYQNEVCGNVLANGSFEVDDPCASQECPSNDPPPGWARQEGTALAVNGDQWVPNPLQTNGYARGSTWATSGEGKVFQTKLVVPGPVELRGDIAGASLGACAHFIELLDGDEASLDVLDRYVVVGDPPVGDPIFEAFDLSGTSETGIVTVRWGFDSCTGGGARATHVDNLYLLATPRGKCNDPFADADGDGDVDQADFGAWQVCFTGTGGGPVSMDCECFDVDGPEDRPDGDVDTADLIFFKQCASGPGVPADVGCDDGIVVPPFAVTSAVSHRLHGSAGAFDLSFLSGDAVECRLGGPQQVIITFDANVQAADGSLDTDDEVSVSAGMITGLALACDELTIDLASVPDESCLTITLHGLALASDNSAVMPDQELELVVLFGDTTADGVVDPGDVDDINASAGQTANSGNFRKDVDLSGDVTGTDAFLAGLSDGNSAACP